MGLLMLVQVFGVGIALATLVALRFLVLNTVCAAVYARWFQAVEVFYRVQQFDIEVKAHYLLRPLIPW